MEAVQVPYAETWQFAALSEPDACAVHHAIADARATSGSLLMCTAQRPELCCAYGDAGIADLQSDWCKTGVFGGYLASMPGGSYFSNPTGELWCTQMQADAGSAGVPARGGKTIKKIPLAHFPRDMFQVGRSIMILRGLTHALGMDVYVQITHYCARLCILCFIRCICRALDWEAKIPACNSV